MMAWQPARGKNVVVLMMLLLFGGSMEAVAESVEETSVSPDLGRQTEPARPPLGGRRLFFTQQQRREATYPPGSVTGGSIINTEPAAQFKGNEDPSQPTRDSESDHSERATQSAVPDIVGVSFDGMVSGPRGTRLLVNGLPCILLSSSAGRRLDDRKQVDCPTVTRSRPLLSLVLLNGRLQVSRDRSVLGLLMPGQGL